MIYLFGFMFIQMIHPLSAGVLIIMQTLIICVIIGTQSMNFWYSYILFLIFLGGLLVLFIYISSLAQNEMFNFGSKWFTKMMFSMLIMMIIYMLIKTNLIYTLDSVEYTPMLNLKMDNTASYFYSNNLMKITMFLGLYLLICLISVTFICQIIKGPMRQKF
uniref:NADH-ubiquinone oxidoreductase chain 6 n=1 Tax=Opisthopatus cinctipes TaxID=574546 RepID=D7QYU4_9BILA|nr:NADH dehydrogenase subunit 6 [Opisthopatus cinctipes]ADE05874.1 NADH dehydrogenase subunit 6 [Opisthopatus cinctipes]